MADSLDCFQIEGVLIDFFCGSGENDANGTRILRGKIACLEIRLIPQFRHSLSDTFFRFFADGWIIFTGSGHGGRRDSCQRSHVLDRYCHKDNLRLFCGSDILVLYVLIS